MGEGLRRIREELGPDALILETVQRNGKVELFVESDVEVNDEEQVAPSMDEHAVFDTDAADDDIQEEYRQAKLKMLASLGDKVSE